MSAEKVIEIDLINYQGIQYYGQIGIGNTKGKDGQDERVQNSTFVFDTGSCWTWVSTKDCLKTGSMFGGSNCQNGESNFFNIKSHDYFDFEKSKSFIGKVGNHIYPTKLFYGQGSISGYLS